MPNPPGIMEKTPIIPARVWAIVEPAKEILKLLISLINTQRLIPSKTQDKIPNGKVRDISFQDKSFLI